MPFLEPDRVLRLDVPSLEVRFHEEVLLHFFKNKQDTCWKSEAGGQLFAFIDGKSWNIVKATGPRKSDYRKRFLFFPSRKDDQLEINASFEDGLHYVGDWHTHPERRPTPSELDLASMVDLVSSSEHHLPGFLMVIVGTEDSARGIWISLHMRKGSLQQLCTA